jgi:hypothetical protein
MDLTAAPLRTKADLDRAIAEARQLASRLDQSTPLEKARFEALLARISAYPGSGLAADPERESHAALAGHLKAFGDRWPRDETAAQREPWKPLLGGDVRPPRTTR